MNQQDRYSQHSRNIPPNRPVLSKEEMLERRRRRRKKRRIQQGIVGGGALLILLLIVLSIVLIARGCSADNKLVGKWDIDGITGYQFNDDGTGAMLLPHTSYEFTYKIDGKNIVFDFKDEKVKDGTFTFEVKGDKLTLVDGENTIGGTYELTRIEE